MAAAIPRGVRSANDFCFREEQGDAITRTTTFYIKLYSRSVIWFPHREHLRITKSIATPFPQSSLEGLGDLGRMPTELLHDVLLRLDMLSLLKLRQVNLEARRTVDSLSKYQLVVSNGLNLFCALLRTRLAVHVSLFSFYDLLCSKSCTFCGEFGAFVFLMDWHRSCFRCLQKASENQLRTLSYVRKHFHLSKTEANRLKSFKTLPGTYSIMESVFKSRTSVVSLGQSNLMFAHKPYAAMGHRPDSTREYTINLMGFCALPYYERATNKVESGMSCAGCQLALEKHMISTSDRDKMYDQASFLEHFRRCEQAQLLWMSSDEGSREPPELPAAARSAFAGL